MRAVLQRVSSASLFIEDKEQTTIGKGFVVLLGIERGDNKLDGEWLARKIANMRVFADHSGKMNCDISEIKGECMVVSQFTLYASTKKGNRPSFLMAASPEAAIPLYAEFLSAIEAELPGKIRSGIFGASMQIELVNDGPVTIIIDSKSRE